MHAEVLVGEHIVALPHNEAPKRPVALTDSELAAAGVFEFVETPYANLDFVQLTGPSPTSLSWRFEMYIARIMAGTPSAAA